MFDTRQTPIFVECFFLPSDFRIALGKEFVCRVPEGMHSANIKTLGKFEDSGSESKDNNSIILDSGGN